MLQKKWRYGVLQAFRHLYIPSRSDQLAPPIRPNACLSSQVPHLGLWRASCCCQFSLMSLLRPEAGANGLHCEGRSSSPLTTSCLRTLGLAQELFLKVRVRTWKLKGPAHALAAPAIRAVSTHFDDSGSANGAALKQYSMSGSHEAPEGDLIEPCPFQRPGT